MDLVSLLIVLVVIGVIFWVLQQIPLPPPWHMIVTIIVALIVVIYLLRMVGMLHV